MVKVNKLIWLCCLLFAISPLLAELPEPTAEKMPLYRGFNLLEKFYKRPNMKPFSEEDFKLISNWGFNFVRLPMDYRCWIIDGDWTKFDEKQLEEIDQAVKWGQKYNIHVCLNFHRAPGYTVASPPEPTSLWTDKETQKICALHWATFAQRYKNIPNKYLSFNLLNEPSNVSEEEFLPVIKLIVESIRKEDPDRLIISDGLNWGGDPCKELGNLNIVQSTRGYQPFNLTHYKASWVNGADTWAEPTWPQPLAIAGFLYGPNQKNLQTPIEIKISLNEPAIFRFKVGTVSQSSHISATIDDKIVWQQDFISGPESKHGETVVYSEQWNIYQNIFNKNYEFKVPNGTYTLNLSNTQGDWLSITSITFICDKGKEYELAISPEWGKKNFPLSFNPTKEPVYFSEKTIGREWLWETQLLKWDRYSKQGHGIIVGEWGAFNQTPHNVTLRWMEDCLKNFQKADFGWALWNFRGPFGILDSGRDDVQYEDYNGHKLDRKMLELLQKY